LIFNVYKNKMWGKYGTRGRGKEVYRVLMEKPEGKSPLGRPRRRRKDGIRVDFRELEGV
jgi:hypothetical protein